MVMYLSVCKLDGERELRKNGFYNWPRNEDRELVKGKAKVILGLGNERRGATSTVVQPIHT